MIPGILSQASAFTSGSDLWVLPDLEKSHWTAKLDWYLNFQICKASRHKALKTSHYLAEVVQNVGLENIVIPLDDKHPLMIASEPLLPNRWIVVIPWEDNLIAWTSRVSEVWGKLNKPSLRIFLPPGQSAGALQSAWNSYESLQEITVVLD